MHAVIVRAKMKMHAVIGQAKAEVHVWEGDSGDSRGSGYT